MSEPLESVSNFNWATYSSIFELPDASEKYTDVLVKAKEGRLTLLNKTLRYLSKNESADTRDFCILIIIKGILKLTIHPYQITSDGLIELMHCLLTEARHFSTEVLTETVSSCLEFMENNPEIDLPVRWIEIFGKMVAVLTTRDGINFSDDIYNGDEFRSLVITSTCRVRWGANNGASVIAALREIPGLSLNDITMILDNGASSLTGLEPTSVPPIAHQLIHLAGAMKPASLIYHFDKYFGSLDFGINEDFLGSADTSPIRKALGSTVYFFIQYARLNETLLREFVRRVKASIYDYKLVITPFTLSVSLGLTSLDHIKPVIVESLRSTISKSFLDINLSADTAWYGRVRGVVSDTITDCFKSVMDTKSSELDFMMAGLKELGVGLLNVEQLQDKDPLAAEKCKTLGIYLITSIIKRDRNYLPGVMNELIKHQKLPYIECLANCLKSVVRTLVSSAYSNRMIQLIHHLPRMTVETASILIKALLPSLQLSHVLMAEMLLILRKTTWKSPESRRISLTALVLMLANSRIMGSIPRSQYSENSEAFLSQASQTQIDVFNSSRSNEPLCFEIISILKRFFSQQLEVKDHLYLELHNVVRKNPELIGIVCCQLLSHVQSYANNNGELSYEKVLDYSNIRDLKMKENLGLLVQCLCSVTLRGQRVFRDSTEGRPSSLESCEEFLGKLVAQLLVNGPEFYEVEAVKHSSDSSQGPLDFWDVRKARNILINEILGALEAFIEFIAMGGKLRHNVSVLKLFKKLQHLKAEVEKIPPKKKGAPKKKKDKNVQNTELDVNTQDSFLSDAAVVGTQFQSEQGDVEATNVTTKAKTKVKLDGGPIKKKFVYQYVMNLDSVREILNDFHGTAEPGSPISSIQGSVTFERYLLAVVTQKLNQLKHKEALKERKRKVKEIIDTLAGISAALWELCQKTDVVQNTTTSANDSTVLEDKDIKELRSSRLSIISALIDFLHTRYPGNRTEALHTFNASPYAIASYEDMFSEFFEVWKKVFKRSTSGIASECCLADELHNLLAILDTFCKSLKPESWPTADVEKWCETFIKRNPRNLESTCDLVESFMKLYITNGTKSCRFPKQFIQFARQAHFVLEDLDNETATLAPEGGVSWLVHQTTAPNIIFNFAQYTGNSIKLVNEVLGRLKANSSFIDLDKLGAWRDDACGMMNFLLKLSTELVRSNFPVGRCGDTLLKVMAQFFSTMAILTGDVIEVHNKNKVDFISKKYEYLVGLIGKDFKMRVEAMIAHIEVTGTKACAKTKKGTIAASTKHKFMKDARSIPDLVYNIEKFEQQVFALSKKTKVDLFFEAKLSTARDFRIKLDQVRGQLVQASTSVRPTTSRSRSTSVTRSSRSASVDQTGRPAPATPGPSRQVARRPAPTDTSEVNSSLRSAVTDQTRGPASAAPGPSKQVAKRPAPLDIPEKRPKKKVVAAQPTVPADIELDTQRSQPNPGSRVSQVPLVGSVEHLIGTPHSTQRGTPTARRSRASAPGTRGRSFGESRSDQATTATSNLSIGGLSRSSKHAAVKQDIPEKRPMKIASRRQETISEKHKVSVPVPEPPSDVPENRPKKVGGKKLPVQSVASQEALDIVSPLAIRPVAVQRPILEETATTRHETRRKNVVGKKLHFPSGSSQEALDIVSPLAIRPVAVQSPILETTARHETRPKKVVGKKLHFPSGSSQEALDIVSPLVIGPVAVQPPILEAAATTTRHENRPKKIGVKILPVPSQDGVSSLAIRTTEGQPPIPAAAASRQENRPKKIGVKILPVPSQEGVSSLAIRSTVVQPPFSEPSRPEERPKKLGAQPISTSTPREAEPNRNNRSSQVPESFTTTFPSPISIGLGITSEIVPRYMVSQNTSSHTSNMEQRETSTSIDYSRSVVSSTPSEISTSGFSTSEYSTSESSVNTVRPSTMRTLGLKRKRT